MSKTTKTTSSILNIKSIDYGWKLLVVKNFKFIKKILNIYIIMKILTKYKNY